MSGFKKICFINAALHGWQSKYRILLLIITVIVLIYLFVKVFIQHAAMRLDDIYIILVDVRNTIWIILTTKTMIWILYYHLYSAFPFYHFYFIIESDSEKKILKNKSLTFIQEMYLIFHWIEQTMHWIYKKTTFTSIDIKWKYCVNYTNYNTVDKVYISVGAMNNTQCRKYYSKIRPNALLKKV